MTNHEYVECPLCMETLEIDDLSFYPCTCGYQICRFCWHRIRTDENGLCPACRKAYSEDPAVFKPLTDDELLSMKKERRQKGADKRQKLADSRKHLAGMRVVQKNLVFVIGLSPRLSDAEVLRRQEYFGKFGKIIKVVVNPNTSYAGSQGHSASAYITYQKPEDAMRAIRTVNNMHIDGKTLKASLGTTKYCSHFLKGTQCNKSDCMYLHEPGDEAASFSKEEMQQGKHTEYEQELYEQFMNSANIAAAPVTQPISTKLAGNKKTSSPVPQNLVQSDSQLSSSCPTSSSLPRESNMVQKLSPTMGLPITDSSKQSPPSSNSPELLTSRSSETSTPVQENGLSLGAQATVLQTISQQQPVGKQQPAVLNSQPPPQQRTAAAAVSASSLSNQPQSSTSGNKTNLSPTGQHVLPAGLQQSANQSLFRPLFQPSQLPNQQAAQRLEQNSEGQLGESEERTKPLLWWPSRDSLMPSQHTNGFIQHNTIQSTPSLAFIQQADANGIKRMESPPKQSSSWHSPHNSSNTDYADTVDDDLGFDPWVVSNRGLQDLLEKETVRQPPLPNGFHSLMGGMPFPPRGAMPFRPFPVDASGMVRPAVAPPGFANNNSAPHLLNSQPNISDVRRPAAMFSGLPPPPPSFPAGALNNSYPSISRGFSNGFHKPQLQQNSDPQHKDWQEGLRALLPNVNISFGGSSCYTNMATLTQQQQQMSQHRGWSMSTPDLSWENNSLLHSNQIDVEDTPHWMASIHSLTEDVPCHWPPTGTTSQVTACSPPPGFFQQQTSNGAPFTSNTRRLTESLQ